jgi:cation transport regulator ChaC
MLYFAYGSNMSSKRLLARTPSAQYLSRGYLHEHRLAFHKVSRDGSAKCNAFYTGNKEDFVIGIIFKIAPHERSLLDEAEGLGNGYEIKQVQVHSESGQIFSSFTYYATHIENDLLPYHWYKQHVLIGAKEYNLPQEYIDVIAKTQAVEDQDTIRHGREMKIYF